MGKHNYSQYSNKKNDNRFNAAPEAEVEIQNGVTETVAEEVEAPVEAPVEAVIDNDTVIVNEAVVEPESTTETKSGAVATGVVARCAKLNVRSKPSIDGDVVTVLNVGDKVSIDVDKSTDEWFKICTDNGVKGFCMRKFVNANI